MESKIILTNLFYYLLSLTLLPPLLLLLPLMYIYREITFLIFQRLYPTSKITRLNSEDTPWTLRENHTNTVEVLFIINLLSGTSDDLINHAKSGFKTKFLDIPHIYPKMTGVLESFMGYSYLIKADVNIDDCFTVVNISDDEKRSLPDIIGDFFRNRPLPLNNKFLWEYVVFKPNKIWRYDSSLKENQIPMVFRYNHVIGDGLSLMNLLVTAFAENDPDINKNLLIYRKKIPKTNVLRQILQTIHIVLLTPGFMLVSNLKSYGDAWKPPKISHRRNYFWRPEGDGGMVDFVKDLKRKIPGTGFSEILMNSISASLQTYFEKMNKSPEFAMIGIVFVGALVSYLNDKNGNAELKNHFSFLMSKLPICIKDKSLLKRLKMIKTETNRLSKSPDLWVYHFMLNWIVGIIPKQILKIVSPVNALSLVISNLPGVPKVTLWKNQEIENMYFFPPHMDYAGTNFTIMTYNDKLHFGLVMDEDCMPSKEACQNLVNGILDNIFSLKKEISNQ